MTKEFTSEWYRDYLGKQNKSKNGNSKVEGIRTPSVMESHPIVRTLATPQVQEGTAKRVIVRVTSVRIRLIDEDNICEKFIIDGLRYAGLLLSDAPDKTNIQTSQRKCQKEEVEHTEIEIETVDPIT